MEGGGVALVAMLVAASLTGALAADRTYMQQTKVVSYDKLAVCNDGSPYSYYYRPGVGQGSNQWVFYFTGGHWCTSQADCNSRYSSNPSLMSSNGYPTSLLHNYGITSPSASNNPYWWGANHVYMNYCTSDCYRGEMQTSTWQFRGRRTVNATVRSLLDNFNLKAATDVILVGSSAGGPGVINGASDIYNIMKAAGANPGRFKIYSDGGWFVDLPEYNGGQGPTYQGDSKLLMSYTGVQWDSGCTSNYPGQEWKCMLPQYNWPYAAAPLINHEYLYDTGNLAEDNANPSNYESFRTSMTSTFGLPGTTAVKVLNLTRTANAAAIAVLANRDLVNNTKKATPYTALTLPGGQGGPVGYKPTIGNQLASPLNIFAEACLLHTTVDTPEFTDSDVNGINFNQALWNWFLYDQYLVQEIDTTPGQRSTADCSAPFNSMTVSGR